jgi:hypothetical protein
MNWAHVTIGDGQGGLFEGITSGERIGEPNDGVRNNKYVCNWDRNKKGFENNNDQEKDSADG